MVVLRNENLRLSGLSVVAVLWPVSWRNVFKVQLQRSVSLSGKSAVQRVSIRAVVP